MSQTKQRQIGYKQKKRRRQRRAQLKKKGLNPNDVFVNGIYVSRPKDR